MKRLVLGLMMVLIAPSLCFAQAARKIPVAVGHDGIDQVGHSFAFALKEAIRGSQSFFLVDYEALPQTPRIVIHMVSVEGSAQQKGVSSAIAAAIVYDSPQTPGIGVFLTVSVLACGSDQVQACAEKILLNIDRAVEFLRKNEPSLWKTL